ncbi:MAG: acyl-CoA dehydratase activase-related protein [Syntrophomonadaceae bacterium]|nr:acyl-CoA dehydratase activase-related protein [Syntrophomonadaceae bacterium]
MQRIGIPHGLFYYYYYPLWKTFFCDLGAEVITSSQTNRRIIDKGIEAAVDEICFPLKVYLGHVEELLSKKLDYIFIPRIVSVERKSYICPKFIGIPDIVRAAIPHLPPMIDTIIDISKTDKFIKNDIVKVGKLFNSREKNIKEAYRHSCQELKFCRALAAQGCTMAEAIKIWEGESLDNNPETDLKIGVLGHGYSLYDESISMNIIKRLRGMGCQVLLPEALDQLSIEAEAATIPKRMFWTLGRIMIGSALHMAKRDDVDGIIYVACFGCGPDSMIGEIIERKLRNKPFMMITIDEHTGENGLVTRLEAFCDMLRRRRSVSCEDNLSAHG